jgi:hypothetical protein
MNRFARIRKRGGETRQIARFIASAAGLSCRAEIGPAGAGDERSPSGAATTRAARRWAEGTANPRSGEALRARTRPEKLSIQGGPGLVQPGARRANQRRKEQEDAKA